MKAYVILDGTVLPINRIAADRPYCSGKNWRLLRKLRCSTHRITAIVMSVLTLHLATASG
ncbi:hypothetical protein GA0115242_118843 [Streptomyces sp. SolWspMP-5a-2]|nr:hypothetical protein GA0115242_118843 [Streptomyces sp. SolWspMP-5a-2]